jgi:hypothetical protein
MEIVLFDVLLGIWPQDGKEMSNKCLLIRSTNKAIIGWCSHFQEKKRILTVQDGGRSTYHSVALRCLKRKSPIPVSSTSSALHLMEIAVRNPCLPGIMSGNLRLQAHTVDSAGESPGQAIFHIMSGEWAVERQYSDTPRLGRRSRAGARRSSSSRSGRYSCLRQTMLGSEVVRGNHEFNYI